MTTLVPCFLVLVLFLARRTWAAVAPRDDSRLGTGYTSIPLLRSGSGTNVFEVSVGTPGVQVNLTVSTNVQFVLVATPDCTDCVTSRASLYDPQASSTLAPQQSSLDYTFVYPAGNLDTLTITASLDTDTLGDPRGDTRNNHYIGLTDSIRKDVPSVTEVGGQPQQLTDGVSGFWGLGIYQANKAQSIIPDIMSRNVDGTPSSNQYMTIGFDVDTYTSDLNQRAGTVHWGGVPVGSYVGDFNWLKVNTTVGGSWGIGFDSFRVEDTVASGVGYFATLDPGFDQIYVPARMAEQFYGAVSGAERDRVQTGRWNIPCDMNISSTIKIAGTEYHVAASELNQRRSPNTCWGAITAWKEDSVADKLGEVRLGTPFLSGIYAALYYSNDLQLVGLAGKPNSVNDGNVFASGGGPNMRLAGILLGIFIPLLVILLIGCYSRNSNTFQSIYYRTFRRQQCMAEKAMMRAATMPPPMMGPMMPPFIPPGAMGPMGPVMPAGPMGPMGPMPMPYRPGPVGPIGPGYGPVPTPFGVGALPMYHAPMQQQQQQQQQPARFVAPQSQHQSGHPTTRLEPLSSPSEQPPRMGHAPHASHSRRQTLPATTEHQAGGYYSPSGGRRESRAHPGSDRFAEGGLALRKGRFRHSVPVRPRDRSREWPAQADAERSQRYDEWGREIPSSRSRSQRYSDPQSGRPASGRQASPEVIRTANGQTPPGLGPALPDMRIGGAPADPNPRSALPGQTHNIPDANTSEKGMWNFRKGSGSVGRGYEAVPRYWTYPGQATSPDGSYRSEKPSSQTRGGWRESRGSPRFADEKSRMKRISGIFGISKGRTALDEQHAALTGGGGV